MSPKSQVVIVNKTTAVGITINGCESGNHIMPFLDNDLAVSQKLVDGRAQFRCGRVKLHAQESVVALEDILAWGADIEDGGQGHECLPRSVG